MNKENILYGIIGLLAGLIIGFMATNYINRTNYQPFVATAQPISNPSSFSSQQPQINQQVVRDQTQTGGMLPQVKETLDRANNEPNNFEAQMTAGEMYNRIGSFEKAGQFFDKASQLKPNNVDALVKAGNAYFDAGATLMEAGNDGTANFKLAEKFYTQALKENPNDVNVRTDLGLTYYYRQPKELDRAIAEYRKSLEVNPNHKLTLQNLSVALKEKGDTAGEQEMLERLRNLSSNNPLVPGVN